MTAGGSTRGGRDAGVATIEFALLFGVLFSLIALAWPLGETFYQKMALDRAMNDTIRYATATPNTPAYDPDGDSSDGRRPTCTQVQDEFYRAYGVSADEQSEYTITIPACPNTLDAGQTVSVTVSKTANLGPLGDLLGVAGITHSSSITVSAAASGREE